MMKIISIMILSLIICLGIKAGPTKFKFLANCKVDGKEIKDVHVHDITYDTMENCETGKGLMAQKKKDRFVRICNEKAKVTGQNTTFSLYCTKE